ncbi:hypothetical protein P389DRAFT_176954 [Cystobasidium minutum MCA 4210]|uniref:uncharacterized protein n=1 Tax=Cystobasidium minutum MCA 4210 TaxID=1397322 RepID=UPI0034CDB3B0|eukprot:jgi/Rhomi1/176954/fgenesh1_pg.1_\
MPSYQYVKAGAASKIASQVRHITLDGEVLDHINGFIDSLLACIIQNIASQGRLDEPRSDFLHPNRFIQDFAVSKLQNQDTSITCPVTTEEFRKACLKTCGKNNTLVKEAMLEAELILNEWLKVKGPDSDAAIPARPLLNAGLQGHSGIQAGSLDIPDSLLITRKRLNRSTSTLQSISDAGEDEQLEDSSDLSGSTPIRPAPRRPSQYDNVPVQSYIAELQGALAHISSLNDDTATSRPTFRTLSKKAIDLQREGCITQTTPLIILYASTFISYLAQDIIKGIADLVEMNPKMSVADMSVLEEYIRSNDDIGTIWMHSQSSSRTTRKFDPSSAQSSLNAGVPQSQIKCGTASLQRSFSTSTASSSSTTVSKRPAKRRLSIDAELASAHREIISLSRASPIERVAAENLRRRSWGEVDVNVDRASLRKEVLDLTGKTEKEGEEAEGSAEKADGILPNSVKLDNQRQEGNVKGKSAVEVSKTTSSVTTSMMESKGSSQHRPDSSLSVKSASRPRAFTSVLRRHSMRKTMKEDSEGEKEVASELTGKRRSSKDAMDKPGKRSASRSSQRSQGHRSSSSINGDGSRNAISKGNRNLHTGSNMQGRDVTRRKSNDERERKRDAVLAEEVHVPFTVHGMVAFEVVQA